MFAKSNKPLFYACIAICFYSLIEFYFKNKDYKLTLPKKTEVLEAPEQKLEIKSEGVIEAINQITNTLKEEREKTNAIKLPPFKTTFFSPQNKSSRVGLCSNSYKIDISLFTEEGDAIYSKNNLNISELKQSKELYSELNRALTLTSSGDRFEVFINSLGIMPAIMVKNPDDAQKSGILKVQVKEVIGNLNFSPKEIKSFKTIYPESTGVSREKSKFFCQDSITISYTFYNSKGDVIKEESLKFTLGKPKSQKEQILEYLTLNSKDGEIDAIVPAKIFAQKNSEQTIIIKGKIFKNNE
jgi:hypothetical protein